MLPHDLSSLGIHVLERGWLSSNCVLFLGKEQTALVDSGYHTHAEQTVAWTRSLLKQQALHALINTHLHSDHCGGNAALQRAYPGVLTSVPRTSETAVRDWDTQRLTFEDTGQDCPSFCLNDTLFDQQTLILADLPWRVHGAKGHDPDAVLLFQPDHRILISADALWENGFGVVFPELTDQPGFDDVSDTLDLIESLDPLLVIPGHGPAFTNVRVALKRARDRLQYFLHNPDKHTRHGLKVLIKFKLLEWQRVSKNDLMQWCCSTPHMARHMPIGTTQTTVWLNGLIDDLERSQALRCDGDWIHDH
jgi:glyoxylase-like metal-dependent hydrolase (beta-lactamase superfamily II)